MSKTLLLVTFLADHFRHVYDAYIICKAVFIQTFYKEEIAELKRQEHAEKKELQTMLDSPEYDGYVYTRSICPWCRDSLIAVREKTQKPSGEDVVWNCGCGQSFAVNFLDSRVVWTEMYSGNN